MKPSVMKVGSSRVELCCRFTVMTQIGPRKRDRSWRTQGQTIFRLRERREQIFQRPTSRCLALASEFRTKTLTINCEQEVFASLFTVFLARPAAHRPISSSISLQRFDHV